MKRFLIIIFIFASVIPASAQTKYFIYFKDKGVSAASILKKSFSDISVPRQYLAPKSIDRRMKSSPGILLSFEDLPVEERYVKTLTDEGIKIHNKLKWFNAVTAYLTDEGAEYIKTLPFVSAVERVKTLSYITPRIEEADNNTSSASLAKSAALDYGPSYNQYALSEIPPAHNAGINGSGVIIGILDSGFDWKRHESLNTADVLAEYDFVFHDTITANEPGDNLSQHNHGTSVFSVIGGYKPGKIIGPAYKARFVLAKTEDVRSETHLEEDNYAAALEWMDSIGVDITTASLGYSNGMSDGDYEYSDMDGKTTIVTKAAEMAFARGITVLNAAGNEGDKEWYYMNAPADGPNVIAVGAVNTSNVYAPFSSHGPTYDGRIKPEITACGVSVYCASGGTVSSYGYSNGTSLAAPIASGIAALLLSANPQLTNVQIRDVLIKSGDNQSSPNNNIGYGLISARRALNLPADTTTQHPVEYSLANNYPNPFNSLTHISFISITEDLAELHIYDILGRRVRTLYKDKAVIGENKTVWDGKNDNGYPCASGIYYYILKIADKEYAKKMVFMK